VTAPIAPPVVVYRNIEVPPTPDGVDALVREVSRLTDLLADVLTDKDVPFDGAIVHLADAAGDALELVAQRLADLARERGVLDWPSRDTLTWKHDDGGRSRAGFHGSASDCVTRALAICTGLGYRLVYDMVNDYGRRRGKPYAARLGVPNVGKLMDELGWQVILMPGGTHLADLPERLPGERVYMVDYQRAHVSAVVDGVVRDTFHPDHRHSGTRRRERVRRVYLPPRPETAHETDAERLARFEAMVRANRAKGTRWGDVKPLAGA
jgi:hypothetical protein